MAEKIEQVGPTPAAKPQKYFDAGTFLKPYQDKLTTKVDAKHLATKLRNQGLISENVKFKLKNNDPEEARQILFADLVETGTPEKIRGVCSIVASEVGYPVMSALGKSILKDKGLSLPTKPDKNTTTLPGGQTKVPDSNSATNQLRNTRDRVKGYQTSIQVNYVYLTNGLSVTDILGELFRENIIGMDLKKKLRNSDTPAGDFVDYLYVSVDDQKFNRFISVLKETQKEFSAHGNLAKVLAEHCSFEPLQNQSLRSTDSESVIDSIPEAVKPEDLDEEFKVSVLPSDLLGSGNIDSYDYPNKDISGDESDSSSQSSAEKVDDSSPRPQLSTRTFQGGDDDSLAGQSGIVSPGAQSQPLDGSTCKSYASLLQKPSAAPKFQKSPNYLDLPPKSQLSERPCSAGETLADLTMACKECYRSSQRRFISRCDYPASAHNKVLQVQLPQSMSGSMGNIFVPVRPKPLNSSGAHELCRHSTKCFSGRSCYRAHSSTELRFWNGSVQAKGELCIDCCWTAISKCRHSKSEQVILFKGDLKIVHVRVPRNASFMKDKKYFCQHSLEDCNRQNSDCNYPHDPIEAHLWNSWMELYGSLASPYGSITQVKFYEELKPLKVPYAMVQPTHRAADDDDESESVPDMSASLNLVAEKLDPLYDPISCESNPDLLLSDDYSPPTPPPPTWKEQYEKAIQQRGSVTLHITRCVLIGPARVGKSSLKLLLINNEPPDQSVEKSTDLMEAPVVLTSIQCQLKGNGSQWKELTPCNFQQLVSKCTREEGYDLAQPNPIQSSHSSQLTPEESISHISTALASETDNVSTPVAESSNTSTRLVELERRYHDFVETTMSEESLAELKINGLKMVHVFDCGGQLAFQDTIPLLINAPCSFISVFNASVDLDEEMELKYCPEKGKELDRGHKESQWNILRRIFSSIHSLQFKCHEDILHLIKGIKVVPSSPIAVVGTHKDVLHKASERDGGLRQRSTEKKIKERLEQLRESKLYDFIREKGCTYDLVANLSKEDLSDINSLRKDIERKATLPLELPLSWIILELFTRHSLLENKFIPIHDLHQLCILKNIVSHKKEFLSLLQVLHVLGFYAFYELDGVPEDQNWVCTDAATLYREVTKLLMVQYKENFRKGATTELKLLGRIKLNKATLEDIFTDLEVNIGGADPMWFIRVLIHIGLAAKIENEGEEEVFIPLALPFKRSDFPPVTSVATICFTLEFPCGANKGRVRANVIEIPRGIFPRLIVHLLSQQRSGEFEWLVNKGDSCSWIKLIHHSYKYVIYLNEHVDHIELALVLNDTFFVTLHNAMRNTQVGHLCRKLRKQLKSALGATFGLVFGEQPLERKPSPVCGLKCSVCRDSPHMAIVRPADESTPQHPLPTEKCVHEGLPKTIKNPDQLIWFPPVKETTFERKETTCGDKQWTIWVMKGTGTSKSDVTVVESVSDLMPYYMDMTAHLFELAAALEVVEFSKALINGHGTPEDKCLQILDHWLESTPSPTWTLLCQKLRSVSSFKAVVHKIATDHNLPTAD